MTWVSRVVCNFSIPCDHCYVQQAMLFSRKTQRLPFLSGAQARELEPGLLLGGPVYRSPVVVKFPFVPIPVTVRED